MTAESQEGSVTWTAFIEEAGEREVVRKAGPFSAYLPYRRGSGSMSVMSKSGDVVIGGEFRVQ